MNSMCCISCCLDVIIEIIILDHGAMTALYQQIQTDKTLFTDWFLKTCFSIVCIVYFTSILYVNFSHSLLIVFSYLLRSDNFALKVWLIDVWKQTGAPEVIGKVTQVESSIRPPTWTQCSRWGLYWLAVGCSHQIARSQWHACTDWHSCSEGCDSTAWGMWAELVEIVRFVIMSDRFAFAFTIVICGAQLICHCK